MSRLNPADIARIDQASAMAREHLAGWDVNLNDPETRRVLAVAYLWFEANRHNPTAACLALGTALGYQI